MCGELTCQLDADQFHGVLVDAEQRDVHHVGQPAEKPVCNKIRIVRGKNDMIKDYILEHKCHNCSDHDGHQ